jgi:transcriptional regulator with XRE-family HTH domain
MRTTSVPFQELLRKRLAHRGELARLAEASGVKAQVITRWRSGESRPLPRNLWAIAPALNVPYEDLMRMCGYLPVMVDVPNGQGRRPADPRLDRVIRRWPSLAEPVKDWLADCADATRPRKPPRREPEGPQTSG